MARRLKVAKGKSKDIEEVLDYIFSDILYQYQKDFILDNSQLKICNKSRQVGISESIALSGLLDVLFKNENVFFVSRSLRQSTSLMDKFYKWLSIFEDSGIVIPRSTQSRTECKINGVDVQSLTSNATTGEGFTGNVYLDEFALHVNDEQLYRSLFPTITMGYSLTIVSRPFGCQNKFYEIWNGEGKYKDFKRFQISMYDAIKQGLKADIKLLRDNIDEEGWKENYECTFLDETTAYFTHKLLTECSKDYTKQIEGKKYIGIDIGRTNDLTSVITLVQDTDNTYWLIDKTTFKNKAFQDQKLLISEIIDKHKPEKVYADKGSVGYQLVEDLERDYKCVEGVTMTNDLKMEAFTNLKKQLELKKLWLPIDDTDLRTELHSIKRDYSAGGKLLFTAQRTSKGHSDSAFALALAIHATGEKTVRPRIILLRGR